MSGLFKFATPTLKLIIFSKFLDIFKLCSECNSTRKNFQSQISLFTPFRFLSPGYIHRSTQLL